MLSTRDAQIIGKPLDRGRVHIIVRQAAVCACRKPLSCVKDRYRYRSGQTFGGCAEASLERPPTVYPSVRVRICYDAFCKNNVNAAPKQQSLPRCRRG